MTSKYGVSDWKLIGNGGFGVVYSALVFELRRAIKISHQPLDDQLLAMAEQELALIKEPTIKNCREIVQLFAVWRELGHFITVWDLGEISLADALKRRPKGNQPPFPPKQLRSYLTDAAQAIDVINAAGYRHRDIKPDNILLFDNGTRAKVTDLGIAVFSGASTLTKTVSVTMGYIALEAYGDDEQEYWVNVLEGRVPPDPTHRPNRGHLTTTVDIYALAATTIKLTTGQDPFRSNPREIFRRQENGQPVETGLAEHQIQAVRAALHPNPKQRRFQTAIEFVDAFFTVNAAASISATQAKEVATKQTPPKSVPMADWKKHSLSDLLGQDERSRVSQRIRELGESIDWKHHSLSELLDSEARISASQHICRLGES